MKNYRIKFLIGWKLVKCSIALLLFITSGHTGNLLAQTAPILKNLEREVASLSTSGSVNVTNTITIEDTDSDQISNAEIKFIEGTYQNIVDNLSLSQNIGNISSNWDRSNGILTLSGTDTKENYEKALRSVFYSFTNWLLLARPEVNKISITVSDGISNSESLVRYIAVKDPSYIPSWISDFDANVNEEETLTFHVDDFKKNYAPDQSKFSGLDIRNLPEHGSLVFNGETLTTNDIINNGGSYRIELGAINQLAYIPNKDFSGSDYFEWNSFDGTSFATTDAKVNITVNEVNDPPVITAPSEIANVPEDTPFTLTGISVNDIDDTQISAELNVSHGVLSIDQALISLLKFSVGDGQADKTLQFTGATGDISNALSKLIYLSDQDFTGTDPLSIKITDRIDGTGATSANATVNLIVVSTNDPPVLTGIPAEPLPYTENDPPVAIAPDITVTDNENHRIISATIKVEEGYLPEEDKINFTTKSGISGTLEGNQLVLNGVAPPEDYQQVIRSITYENISEKPTEVNRVVSFQLTDEEDAVSEIQTRAITVKNVDDPPVLANIENNKLNFVQFGGPITLTNNITISDIDDEVVEKAIISITNNSFVTNQDVLLFQNTDKINSTWNATNGILTLTGTATLEEYKKALRKVVYDNTSENPNKKERTVSFQVSSNGTSSNVVNRKINIIVNERPTISSFSRETAEDQSVSFQYKIFLEEGQYEDPDNFPSEGGFSHISIRTLPQHGILVANGDTLTQALLDNSASGYEIAGDSIHQLLYIPTQDYHGTDSFAWNAFDGAQYAAENATVEITITPQNDAPLVLDFAKTVDEDDTLTFSLTDFTEVYDDVEEDALQKIIIRGIPSAGNLLLNGLVIPANTEIGVANIENLIYIPSENFNGSDNFAWSASDGNLFSEKNALVSITVNPVNDAPALKTFTKAVAKDQAIRFSLEDFNRNYADVENNEIAYILIETVTQNGQLLLNGQPLSAGSQIGADEVSQLTYQPDPNAGVRDSFTWNAFDGTDLSPNSATVNIIVGIGVSDFSLTLNEDASYNFSANDFINNYGNPDGELQEIKIEALPVNGTLSLGESPVTEGQSVDINALDQLVYTPNLNYYGMDSIIWNATDGNRFSEESASIYFNIKAVNDAPEISPIENITLVAGDTTELLAFTVNDIETDALEISAFSENQSLISDTQITLGGSGNNRTVSIITLAGKSGEAVITILASDGDQQVQQSFTLTIVPYFITLEAGEDIDYCSSQPLDIHVQEVSGGVAPYTYSWTCNQEDCYIVSESDNTLTINPDSTVTYNVQITDANGIVSNQDSITVNVVNCHVIELNIPTGFTPDGDGIHDVWLIDRISYVDNVVVEVYNRLGQQVFRSEGYTDPWNGSSGGNDLPVGTYYYIVNVDNGSRIFKGSVTILR